MSDDMQNLYSRIEKLLSDMGPGCSDSGLSSSDSFSQDMDLVGLSLQDPTYGQISQSIEIPNKMFLEFLIENKISYLHQVTSSITNTKKNFMKTFCYVNADIDRIFARIVHLVKERESQLKSQLGGAGKSKIREWDRQLFLCQNAMDQLRAVINDHTCFNSGSAIAYCEMLIKDIEFVDSGAIAFEAGDLNFLETFLQGLGSVSYSGTLCPGPNAPLNLRGVTPKFIFGSGGGNPGEFCRPWGVCTDATGRILVSDRSNHRIQIFNESGEFLLSFGKEGSKSGEFNRPAGIAVDKNCRIIVADKDNHRIQVFTSCGNFLFMFGREGGNMGEFLYPWGIAVNSNCDIAVSDSKNKRIQLFNQCGHFLTFFDYKKMGIRDYHTGLKRIDSPRGLAFRPDGSLMVTDFNNHHVMIINQSFTNVTIFGREGANPRQFFRPQGIACDDSGRFAVADSKNYRIQVFDAQKNVCKVFGTQGLGPGEFDCPQGICFHPNRNIIVVDLNNNRIQVF